MKKSMPATTFVAFPLLAKTTQLKAYGCVAIVFLLGCTTPDQVRWDARKMREQVMIYYNDEIMDNLIRMQEGLPFVHVDISSVTAIATSQITGTIGGGETRGSTQASASMIGALGTLSRVVTRPFAYSVSPQRGDSLTITAAPVFGGDDSTNTNIYEPYKTFGKFLKCNGGLAYRTGLIPPTEDKYVPGTLKWHVDRYYYIRNEKKEQEAYYTLCMNLFTKKRPKSLVKDLEMTRDVGERIQGQQAIPPAPR